MCTTFILKKDDELVFGRNLDMFTDVGYAFTNHRNIKKSALLMPPEKPLTWVSEYGNITFNQAGKEFPHGGMNERGLVVEQMTLPETKYPETDQRPGINDLQWIQYILDTCATVDDVIKTAFDVRVSSSANRLHYLIADQEGKVAVIEHIEGKMIIYSEDKLPIFVLTNTNYKDSLRYYYDDLSFEYDKENYYISNSLDRFKKAAQRVELISNEDISAVDCGFNILREIRRVDTTWSIVYDIKNLTIYFHTQHYPKIKILTLRDFDFSNQYLSKAMDMNNEGSDNVNHKFSTYNTEINRKLIFSLYRNDAFMKALNIQLSDEILEYLAVYPEQMVSL